MNFEKNSVELQLTLRFAPFLHFFANKAKLDQTTEMDFLLSDPDLGK